MMKTYLLSAVALVLLFAGAATPASAQYHRYHRHHRQRVCTWRHHHRVCYWR